MPLIRYRTGDYTRILPPCKCGGVTKRIDTVSRREGELSIEKLDSALFRIPGLVDYRASLDGKLVLEVRVKNTGAETQIQNAVAEVYPHAKTALDIACCQLSDRPMYLGKRHVARKE